MDKKLGISNNFYVKLSKTNDVNILYDMAKIIQYPKIMNLFESLAQEELMLLGQSRKQVLHI
jgi:hypothetical protein